MRLACFARHDRTDPRLGIPFCLDCYDHDGQVVWNLMAGELWRRTTIAINRHLRRISRQRGIPEWRVSYLAATARSGRSWCRRGGCRSARPPRCNAAPSSTCTPSSASTATTPTTPDAILPPPAELDADDLKAAVDHAAATVAFTTDPHPTQPEGWRIGWGDQVLTKLVTVAAEGEVTDAQVAAYLAKYATKSTEVTGHTSGRLTGDTVELFADPHGTHTERLIDACWRLGRARWTCPACHQRSTRADCPVCAARHGAEPPEPSPYRRLHRWAHMLGFGGHFLTKSRRYSRHLHHAAQRPDRVPPHPDQRPRTRHDQAAEPTTLVVNFLQFVGAGWQTPADAMLANTSAAMAREHQEAARQAPDRPWPRERPSTVKPGLTPNRA